MLARVVFRSFAFYALAVGCDPGINTLDADFQLLTLLLCQLRFPLAKLGIVASLLRLFRNVGCGACVNLAVSELHQERRIGKADTRVDTSQHIRALQ